MSNVDINVDGQTDRRTDGRKIGRLYRTLLQAGAIKIKFLIPNSADPYQLASSEANWSGSTLFAKAGYIQVQQDKG